MPRFDVSQNACVLCNQPLQGQLFFPVYLISDYGAREVTLSEHRIGFFHVSHLMNIYNPAMIDVRVMDQMGAAIQPRVEVRIHP